MMFSMGKSNVSAVVVEGIGSQTMLSGGMGCDCKLYPWTSESV